ncbi:MAG: hypothetical protein EOP05_09040 [Proteobacteria bacterium]|nr:MAG: hypothetical protein EOP05_09040 [Pseudomonadota bacterium]
MEQLLAGLDQQFGTKEESQSSLVREVGHQSKDLRAWGVLDSVLRMVQAPNDLFAQSERFLSYFISPAPPIGEVKRTSDSVSFVLPISEERYPYVTSFLCAAFEALPTYINKPMASVTWENSCVTIKWSEAQESLFNEVENAELSLHPELVSSILSNLESSQKELEETKIRLIESERELDRLRANGGGASYVARQAGQIVPLAGSMLSSLANSTELKTEHSVSTALHDLYRLGDYFARGQQLVTMLIAQGRQTPQVKEAMRRVDWPFVCETAPAVIREAIKELQDAQVRLRDAADQAAAAKKEMTADPNGSQTSFFASRH